MCYPGNSAGFACRSLFGHAHSMETANAQAHPDRRHRDNVVIRVSCQSEPGLQRTAAGTHRAAQRSGPRSQGRGARDDRQVSKCLKAEATASFGLCDPQVVWTLPVGQRLKRPLLRTATTGEGRSVPVMHAGRKPEAKGRSHALPATKLVLDFLQRPATMAPRQHSGSKPFTRRGKPARRRQHHCCAGGCRYGGMVQAPAAVPALRRIRAV